MFLKNLDLIIVVLSFISVSKCYRETITFIAKTWEHGVSLIRVLVMKHKQSDQRKVGSKPNLF